MAYIAIENFKYGLDTRRSELTSLPGTLLTLTNAHINQGGEIEKRKAFIQSGMTTGCFGLEGTDSGLKVFGSIADPGGWPRGPVTGYQRLIHPAVGIFGATFDGTKHAMTSIPWSSCYQGKAYVAATYADGFTFLFYNGQPIMNSYTGLILSGFGTNNLRNAYEAADLAHTVASITNWHSLNLGISTNMRAVDQTNVYSAQVDSPATITFTFIETQSSTNGGYGSINNGPLVAVTGTAGTGAFVVNGGAGDTYDLWGDTQLNGIVFQKLMAQVAWAASNANTATLIAAAVNLLTAKTGYSASAGGVSVTVTNPLLTLPSGFEGNFALQTYQWVGYQVVHTVAAVPGTTVINFSQSTYSLVAYGQDDEIGFGGTWAIGDWWSFAVTSTAGDITWGRGNLGNGWWASGTVIFPPYGYVFNNRVYIANGQIFNFSGVGIPGGFEEQDIGAGFISYTSQYGVRDLVQSFAAYQGRLAVFGRRSVQVWLTDANPDNFALQQTLTNIGTLAPLSVQSLGDLDVLFLYDSGIRSLRVRDSSLNATVTDIGSPIDSIITTALLNQPSNIAAIVEPTQSRYWLAMGNLIYVLSYFPLNKITAWSIYNCTYQGGGGTQVPFTPSKFVVFQNQVFVREEGSSGGSVYTYGGTDNNTYDNVTATATTPWLDAKKPGTYKQCKGVDVAWAGAWDLKAGTDFANEAYQDMVYQSTSPSFDFGGVPFSSKGTHFSFQAVTTGSTAATLSSMILHYEEMEETI